MCEKKPVRCVCGGEAQARGDDTCGYSWVCGKCGAASQRSPIKLRALGIWNHTQRALKHFDDVFNALGKMTFDPCDECPHFTSEACRKSCEKWIRYEKARTRFEAACMYEIIEF